MIHGTLRRMNVRYSSIETIREKDGIGVYRVCQDGLSPIILKIFEREDDRREIENYRILHELGIQTLELLNASDEAILLEDVAASDTLRLGVAEDMDDPEICLALGRWYRKLHNMGRDYAALHKNEMYTETECLERENIEYIMRRTATEQLPVWACVLNALPQIRKTLSQMPLTLTYNDFYYTNLVVAQDKSFAFMFDYNLLGCGLAASDIRNVTWSLGENGKRAFLSSYGEVDFAEKQLDDVINVLATLFLASKRDVFPNWAGEAIDSLKNGKLSEAIYQNLKER